MKIPQQVHINAENSILIIVDVQNEGCKPGGKLYQGERPRLMPKVISHICALAEQARSANIPIIYIQSVRTLKEAEFTVFGLEPLYEPGTWAVEIVDELQPHKGEVVVQKFTHDPFYKTGLDQLLQRLVPDPTRCYAVITGGSVGVCAYHTVLGFHLRDYWTIVPVDCIFYTRDADRRRALEQLSHQAYPNVFLSRSDLIEVCQTPAVGYPTPIPGK